MNFLIDTHCHFYPSFDPYVWLLATVKNLSSIQNAETFGSSNYGVILTERSSEDYFLRWKEQSPFCTTDGCHLQVTDSGTLRIHQSNHRPLTIYPGQQILTAEKLEVLCITNRTDIPDGLPIQETIEEMLLRKEIPVLPWSFGKWLGNRRHTVFSMLERFDERLFIGDITHRPPLEPLERIAARFGKRILGGSDPLPTKSYQSRAGYTAASFSVERVLDDSDSNLKTICSNIQNNPTVEKVAALSFFEILKQQIAYKAARLR